MKTIEILFWISLFIVAYTYVGYGIILYLAVKVKRLFKRETSNDNVEDLPEVTLMIPAYNEKEYIQQKVRNTRELDYPKEKIKAVWVTDGSDDGSPQLLEEYDEVTVLHKPERNGKIAAMNRAVQYVKTPVVIFSDANTLLSKDSVRIIATMFRDPKIGCVSGEKRITADTQEAAAGAGEGLYWKYESTLKKWDAELYSVVGAAGELFAVRTELYKEVEPDTILDDFIISLRIAMQGYKIAYNPEAYAIETASANVAEELKRKVRIAAGGIQSIIRLYPLLNIFKFRTLSFQYISHRVMRWTITPLLLPVLLITNSLLYNFDSVYAFLLIAQFLFYFAALIGWILKNNKISIKGIFIPYYFFIMNYAVYKGFFRYLQNNQSVNWERAKRA